MSDRIVWIVGATASLGKTLSHLHAKRGDSLVLTGRSLNELEELSHDIYIRYHKQPVALVMDFANPKLNMEQVLSKVERVDVMYVLVGDMGDQDFENPTMIERVLQVNFVQPAKWLTLIANYLKKQQSGAIAVVGSVAGDRGRASNYPYGSAKGGLALFVDGLRGYLARTNIHVVTFKLGFTDTPMTYGKVDRLVASRRYVARKMMKAVDRRKDIVYIPFFWRYIMWVIKVIPEKLFKYMKL